MALAEFLVSTIFGELGEPFYGVNELEENKKFAPIEQ